MHLSPREVGVLGWRLESEMRARFFFREQEVVKEKISKFDDKGGSTIGKNRRRDSKNMNMAMIKKKPSSVDERVNEIRV